MKNISLPSMAVVLLFVSGCGDTTVAAKSPGPERDPAAEYFLLRPDVEKAFGYSHAVRVGGTLKVSGAVSMDDAGTPVAAGDLEEQMRNVYSDLEKVLAHYGYGFEDVIVENVYVTDMAGFMDVAGYRNEIYTEHFPTGTWAEVKGLALPEFMIEIEIEAYKAQ